MSAPQPRHHFEWDNVGGIAVIRFTTSTLRDERIIRTVFDALDDLIDAGHLHMVIAFTGLEVFASFAIGKLIRLNDRLVKSGGRLVLCSLTPIVAEIVDLMNLRKKFTIYATEREALESFV
jgi:anti-sigma B factor antagonist